MRCAVRGTDAGRSTTGSPASTSSTSTGAGRLSQDQVCDAHPELIRAAKNVGTAVVDAVPDLRGGPAAPRHVRVRPAAAGPRQVRHDGQGDATRSNRRREELSAYVVEACVGCRWHHLRRVLPVGGR